MTAQARSAAPIREALPEHRVESNHDHLAMDALRARARFEPGIARSIGIPRLNPSSLPRYRLVHHVFAAVATQEPEETIGGAYGAGGGSAAARGRASR
jgi:hypothetical protein